jgi:hypothetical protein
MRIGLVFVALLAVLAVACDRDKKDTESAVDKSGGGPSSVDQEFSGKSWTTDVDKTTGHSKTVHHLIAKGESGKATIDAQLVFETHDTEAVVDERCPKEYPYGANLVSLTWVQTYNDGSSFTGVANPPGSAVCTDGTKFYASVKGVIAVGAGPRFGEVTGGTWQAETWVDEKVDTTGSGKKVENTTGNVQASFTY